MSSSGCTATLYSSLQSSMGTAAADELCKGLGGGLNTSYLLLSAFLVFAFQAGFAMIVAGRIRTHKSADVLVRSLIAICLAGVTWYTVGYGESAELPWLPDGMLKAPFSPAYQASR